MANWKDLRESFEQRLRTNYSTTEIAWDNTIFTPPTTSWIRATMIPTNTMNAALGGLCVRYEGIFWIQVFVPLNSNTNEAYTIASEVSTIFENVQFSGITCGAPETERTGDESHGWFQVNVKVPFFFHDEFDSISDALLVSLNAIFLTGNNGYIKVR